MIPPKLHKEIVEQISAPLAQLFNLSLEEGINPSERKEANIMPLFKKGSRNKSDNYRPVSLTYVVCKLLKILIRDQVVEFFVKQLNKYNSTWIPKIKVLSNQSLMFFGRNFKVGR